MGLEGARENLPKRPDQDIESRVIDKNEEARLREEAEWEAELKKEKDIENRRIEVELAREARLKVEAEVELKKLELKIQVSVGGRQPVRIEHLS
jgi:hypothetical protein